MNDAPFSSSTMVEVRTSAWLEEGVWYARIDFCLDGRAVGTPRIYRDQPQENMPQALALARDIAESLDGKIVS